VLSARTAFLTNLGDSPAVAGFDAPSSASPLVELVGVAGAGKTTLLKALTHRDPSLCTHPKVGPVRRLDLLARHTLRFVPRLLDRAHRGRWLSWHELRLMAYLEGWLPSAIHRTRPTLFDHGPIFILVQLSEFGPPLVASPDFQAWWRAARSAWARALGIVVWLDAPDTVLGPRIDGRDQRHAVKHQPAETASEFLARYRKGYEQHLEEMSDEGHFRLIRFDTSRVPLESIVEEVLSAIRAKRAEPTSSVRAEQGSDS
jgi:shikimate kinase